MAGQGDWWILVGGAHLHMLAKPAASEGGRAEGGGTSLSVEIIIIYRTAYIGTHTL